MFILLTWTSKCWLGLYYLLVLSIFNWGFVSYSLHRSAKKNINKKTFIIRWRSHLIFAKSIYLSEMHSEPCRISVELLAKNFNLDVWQGSVQAPVSWKLALIRYLLMQLFTFVPHDSFLQKLQETHPWQKFALYIYICIYNICIYINLLYNFFISILETSKSTTWAGPASPSRCWLVSY